MEKKSWYGRNIRDGKGRKEESKSHVMITKTRMKIYDKTETKVISVRW